LFSESLVVPTARMKRLVFCLFVSSSKAFVVSSAAREQSYWTTHRSQLGVSTTTKTPPPVEQETTSTPDLLKSLQQQSSITANTLDSQSPLRVLSPYSSSHEQSLLSTIAATASSSMMDTDKQAMSSNNNSLSLWQGRLIVLAAAAIFGTNFATVKMLDQVVPTSVSMALRFVLAAVAISTSVAWQYQQQRQETQLQPLPEDIMAQGMGADSLSSTSLNDWVPAAWLGAEVGAWYLIGYLCQSYGLHYVAASKVSVDTIVIHAVSLLRSFSHCYILTHSTLTERIFQQYCRDCRSSTQRHVQRQATRCQGTCVRHHGIGWCWSFAVWTRPPRIIRRCCRDDKPT
jgi:hypothetical protein